MGILEIRACQLQKVTYSLDSQQAIDAMNLTRQQIPNCNYLMFDFFVNHDDVGNCTLREPPDPIQAAIRNAKNLGYKTILRARKTDQMTFLPSDVQLYFQSYGDVLRDVAVRAQIEGVDLLIIGCEYDKLEGAENNENWRNLVTSLRAIFTGKLSYEFNWFDTPEEYQRILGATWLQTLDFFTISMYLQLKPTSGIPPYDSANMWVPTVEELKQGYLSAVPYFIRGQNYVRMMLDLTNQIGKKVLLVTGLASTYGFVAKPWSFANMGIPAVSLQEQANYFKAMLETWIPQKNIVGFLLDGATFTNAVGKDPDNGEFIVLNKPAASVINDAYFTVSEENPVNQWNITKADVAIVLSVAAIFLLAINYMRGRSK